MKSFNLDFFRYTRTSHQKQSACNVSGVATFISKVLAQGGSLLWYLICYIALIFPAVQIVTSPLILEILKDGFQFSTSLIALF